MRTRRAIVVYIAGSFRGPNAWAIEQNVRRAEALALEVWLAGFTAICPHANTRFFQGAAPDEAWLEGDIEILKRCDALIVAPESHDSKGTQTEVEFAQARGIPCFGSLERLTHHFPPEVPIYG